MPSMGDLVTNLVIDSTRFVSGVDRARDSNTALSGSVNSIIGQLERQKKAFETAGRSTLDWINADVKASNETKELAKSLLQEVDALNKLAAARRALPTSTVVGKGNGGLSDFQKEQLRQAEIRDRHAMGMPTSTVVGKGNGGKSDKQLADERNASDPFLSGMSKWQNEHANNPFVRGLRNQANADANREPDVDRRREAARARDQQEADEAKARDNADRIRKEQQRIRADRAAERDAENTRQREAKERLLKEADLEREKQQQKDDAERQRKADVTRGIYSSQMDRRRLPGEALPGVDGVTDRENQRFLREREQLSRKMQDEGIDSPADKSMLNDSLKKTQREEVANRIEEERIAILERLDSLVKSASKSEDEYALAKLRGRNASEEEIKAAQDRVNEHTLGELRARGASKDELELAKKRMNQTHEIQAKGSQGKDNRKWAGVEGFRAIEDFAQGSANGGLRGGLLAASNNISQMGAALGAAGAMAGSAVSTVVVLGSQLYETWRKAATGGNEATAAIKEYDRMTTSVLNHTKELHQLQVASRGIRNEGSFSGALQTEQSLKDEVALREREIRDRGEARGDMLGGMGAQGMTAADLDKEAARREDTIYGLRLNAASAQAANLSDEALNIENRQKVREQERQELRDNQILLEKRRQLQQAEQITLARGQHDADVAEDKRRAHERGGAGPLTEWQQMDKERGFANEQNAKEKSKFEAGQSWYQNRNEQLMLAEMGSDKERAYYQANKEDQESLRKTKEALDLGVISRSEATQLDHQSQQNRDRQMRQAKYGDLQADGQTGFGSQDARSTGGMNAIMKAINYATQDKTIAELKKNGDISQEIVTAVNNVAAVIQTAPVPVVQF